MCLQPQPLLSRAKRVADSLASSKEGITVRRVSVAASPLNSRRRVIVRRSGIGKQLEWRRMGMGRYNEECRQANLPRSERYSARILLVYLNSHNLVGASQVELSWASAIS